MKFAALSLRDLEYAVAVAEERHFGRAAERCNVSQPALSAQVRKLEELLGLVLFERTSRRVLPTPGGEAVVAQARILLGEAAKLIAVASEGHGGLLKGRFALGAIPTLGPYLFPKVLRPLRLAFPELSLHLTEARTAELTEGLRDGRVDAALLSLPVDVAGVTVSPLFIESFLFACPADHPFADRDPLAAADLGGPDLLLLDEGNCLRDQTLDACQMTVGAGRHATSLETLRSMVAAGAGYTLLPRLASRLDPEGLVLERVFSVDRPGRTIALVWRSRDPRAASFEALARFLREHAPDGTEPVQAVGRPGDPTEGASGETLTRGDVVPGEALSFAS